MKTTMLPVTDRAQRVVQTADAERCRLGHPVLTPQHMLWALLADKGSVATQVLWELHFDASTLEKRLGPDWAGKGGRGPDEGGGRIRERAPRCGRRHRAPFARLAARPESGWQALARRGCELRCGVRGDAPLLERSADLIWSPSSKRLKLAARV